jgi:hypothetical protein
MFSVRIALIYHIVRRNSGRNTRPLALAEAFVRKLLTETFKQKADAETVRAVAQKISRVVAESTPEKDIDSVAKLATPSHSDASEHNESEGNEISILLTPQGRLQVSVDLDDKGLDKLKQMISKYEEILKLMQ